MLQLFSQSDAVNEYLSIEPNEKFPQGFIAVWEIYTKEPQENNSFRFNYLLYTFTLTVDVDVKEKAIHLKTKNFSRSARVPEGEKIFDPRCSQVKIGKLADL